MERSILNRRRFLSLMPAATACGMLLATTPPSSSAASREPSSVGAIENLMRGHGLLLRAIIIYDVMRDKLSKGQQIDPSPILKTASVFQNYLEAFHEKAEEAHIFMPLEKANILFDSIQELKIQHGSGFELTQRIINLAKAGKLGDDLAGYLSDFVRMYRHHAAWEDTVVFPAFDSIKNRAGLAEVAEAFNNEERSTLGHSGFQSFLDQIAGVEKDLGIYELSTSTPKL